MPTPSDGLAGHRRALDAFLARAESVHPDDWNRAPATDKWSPAQIAEHLRLTYLVVGGELEGRPGLRVRTSWWLRHLLRFRYLGVILDRGAIPANAGAPRELRPGPGPFDRRRTLDELARLGAEFEVIVPRRPDAGITHHVFGRLSVPDMVRFATVHLDHHARQLGSDR